MVFKLNGKNTGDLDAVIPEPSWFWRLLDWTERVVQMKIIDTDYSNYDVIVAMTITFSIATTRFTLERETRVQ